MAVSRRDFMRTLGVTSAGALALPTWANARGLEAATAEPLDVAWQQQPDVLRLESNENPNGPVPAAIRASHITGRTSSGIFGKPSIGNRSHSAT